jgi:hypothetical protein
MAQVLLSQSPRVKTFKVGRRGLPFTQKIRFTPTSIEVGQTYTISGKRANGTVFTLSYTVVTSDTVALIIDGLVIAAAAVSPAIGATTTDNTTSLDFTTSTAGVLLDYSWSGPFTVHDETTDPGIATDLAAVIVEDPNFYGFAIDSNSEAEINAAAAAAEAAKKMFAASSVDTGIGTSSTTDVASDLNTAAYKYTALFVGSNVLSYAGCAALGIEFPQDPGKSTLGLKTPSGVTVPNLSATARGYILAKKANHISTYAGRNLIRNGTMASGQFWDVTRFVDYLTAQIQENLFLWLANQPKVPYSDASVAEAVNVVLGCLQREMPLAIAATPAPTITAPLVADVSAGDKADRILPDIEFTATYAGAIQGITISGRIVL